MNKVDTQMRVLHTMLRVTDIEASIQFYTHILGMRVLRSMDQPEDKYSLTFLGYGDETSGAVLELTYNYGVTEYELGNAYGHFAIGVTNIQRTFEDIESKGVLFSLKPTQLKGNDEIIAFLTDPDGYQIELIERRGSLL